MLFEFYFILFCFVIVGGYVIDYVSFLVIYVSNYLESKIELFIIFIMNLGNNASILQADYCVVENFLPEQLNFHFSSCPSMFHSLTRLL